MKYCRNNLFPPNFSPNLHEQPLLSDGVIFTPMPILKRIFRLWLYAFIVAAVVGFAYLYLTGKQ